MTFYRIYFRDRSKEAGFCSVPMKSIVVEGERERDRIMARKTPRALHYETCRLHRCSVCDVEGPWTDEWSWWGSYQQIDDGKDVKKFCSAGCKDQDQMLLEALSDMPPWLKTRVQEEPGRVKEDTRALVEAGWQERLRDREVVAHRKVPMPEWKKSGSCRWCLKPTVYETGKKIGQLAPGRNWHNACYYQYRLHTELAAQFDFLFTRDGPRCQICGAGGYASAGEHVEWPKGMPWKDYQRLCRDPDAPRRTILKPSIALDVDHVIPLWKVVLIYSGDLTRFYGPVNLWLICNPCHKRKNADEAAERARLRRSPAAPASD